MTLVGLKTLKNAKSIITENDAYIKEILKKNETAVILANVKSCTENWKT